MAVTAMSEGRQDARPKPPAGAADAARILDRLTSHFHPGSLLDVGCGRGVLLATAREQFGIDDVQGIGAGLDDLLVPSRDVAVADLSREFDLGRRYDVACALEVAQDLDPAVADRFVAQLVGHASAIVFSAAIPGQGGLRPGGGAPANAQFLDYWQARFASHGYRLVDLFRPVFWDDDSLPLWCRQNLVLFVNADFAQRFAWVAFYQADGRVALVHPRHYEAQQARWAALKGLVDVMEQRQSEGKASGAGEPASRGALQALERYALLGLGQRRAGDRQAQQHFATGAALAPEWTELLAVLPAMSPEMQQKLTKQLVGEGLVGLSALLCETFLQHGTNRKLLIEPFATSLHYIGFGERALAALRESGLMAVDKSVLSIAVGILVDREAFDEAREAVGSSSVDNRTKHALLARINAVDTTTARLAELPHGPESPVFIVNLLQDSHRRQAFTARLAQLDMRHSIVRGVRVDDIPEGLAGLLRVRGEQPLDGSFGNQLSQYGVWKAIASGNAPHGVVLEDDGFVRYRGLSRLAFEELAPDVDIIFLNDRLAPAMTAPGGDTVQLDPLEDVLAARSFSEPEVAALGSDGYVLSKRGAEKMVQIAEAEGFHTVGTDWYLICHAFDYRGIDAINTDSVMAKVLRSWAARVQGLGAGRLTGMVMRPALVEHRPLGTWRSGRVYL